MKEIVVSKALFSRYKTISDAVKGASSGTTIVVKPGVYRENIYIDKDINIISEGDKQSTVIEAFKTAIYIDSGSKVFIKGIQIKQFGSEDDALIYCEFGVLQIQECDIYPGKGSGVVVQNHGSLYMQSCQVTGGYANGINFNEGSQGTIENCEIHGMKGEEYPSIFIGKSSPNIKNCRIHSGPSNAIYMKNGGKPNIENCDLSHMQGPVIYISNSAPAIKKCNIHDGESNGIYMEESQPIIENCEIFNFEIGMVFIHRSKPTIRQCRVFDGKTNAITFKGQSAGLVEECEIFNLSGETYPAIWIEDSQPVWKKCKVSYTADSAYNINNNSNPTIENCEIYKAGNNVFQIVGATAHIQRCKIYDGQTSAFSIQEASQPLVEECEIFNFKRQLVAVYASNPTFRNCKLYDGQMNAVSFEGNGGGLFEECELYQFFNETYPIIFVNQGQLIVRKCKMHNGASNAIYLKNDSKVILEECEISQFQNESNPVILGEQSYLKSTNCKIHEGNNNAVYVKNNSECILDNCEIGHFHNDDSMVWADESRITLTQCDLYNGKSGAVVVNKNSFALIEDCKLTEFNKECVKVSGESEALLQRNNMYNALHGIGIVSDSQSEVIECEIYDCRGTALWLDKGQAKIDKIYIRNCKGNALNLKNNSGIVFYNGSISQFEYPMIYSEESQFDVRRSNFNHGKSQIFLVGKDSEFCIDQCDISQAKEFPAIDICSDVKGTIQKCNISEALIGIRVASESKINLTDIKCFDIDEAAYQIDDNSSTVLENCKAYIEVSQQRIKSNGEDKQEVEDVEKVKVQEEDIDIEAIMMELNRFVGMDSVKEQIEQLINYVEISRYRKAAGLDSGDEIKPKHTVFYGNPGTGKTTIARLLGKVYKALGLLEKGHIVEVKREDLVGSYIGHSEEKTKGYIDEAMGGVLFIDEAYSLSVEDSSRDFGNQVIDVLLAALENHRGEFLCVVAGYEKEMERFIASNPGLKSRFVSYMKFEDYTPDELMEIGNRLLEDKQYELTPEAQKYVYEQFVGLYRKRDEHFGNARMVREQVDKWKVLHSDRIRALPRSEWRKREVLTTIHLEDVEKVFQQKGEKKVAVPINEKLLQEQMDRLNDLIGLTKVKEEIQRLIQLVSYYQEEGKDISELSMHISLIGNPGTGKTEVARIIAKVYEALGILERGDCIEVDRKELVDKFQGGTEEKTANVLQQAMGGTLFIDEAYTLTNKGSNDVGHIAVELLLKQMEDRRGEFIVLVAGYEDEMEEFLDSNKGLRRRFDYRLVFEDYTPEEMIRIAGYYMTKKQYHMSGEARNMLVDYFTYLYENRDKTYGNAGLARKIIEQAMKNLDYRIATLPVEHRMEKQKYMIDVEDIQALLQQQEQ
ncbi:TPA: right-handed parallel beta-helix repeat-containing protein [Bacillus thuringiensis]|nr:right-handed parallel beta-helix repeat-containing protein [Bacillus thuringiensis]